MKKISSDRAERRARLEEEWGGACVEMEKEEQITAKTQKRRDELLEEVKALDLVLIERRGKVFPYSRQKSVHPAGWGSQLQMLSRKIKDLDTLKKGGVRYRKFLGDEWMALRVVSNGKKWANLTDGPKAWIWVSITPKESHLIHPDDHCELYCLRGETK